MYILWAWLFASPAYMTVQTWISVMLLHLDHFTITGQNVYKHKILSLGGRVYFSGGSMALYHRYAKYIIVE